VDLLFLTLSGALFPVFCFDWQGGSDQRV